MLLYLFLLWLVLFLVILVNSYVSKDADYDRIFMNHDYKYEDVVKRLELIEKLIGRKLKHIRNRLAFYNKNARQTRRRFEYYSDYIEPVFLRIVFAHEGGDWRFFWKKSSFLVKIFLMLILSIPTMLFIGLQALFMEEVPDEFLLALPAIIIVILGISAYFLIFNIQIFNMTSILLYYTGAQSGIFERNITAMGALVSSKKFYTRSALLLGAGGAISAPAGALGGFKGMGGGHFGGGGSGASW